MIIETKVYSCRKCQSEDLVKNGTNASSSSQYKRLSMKDPVCAGLNRRLGVSRRTLSAWLKEQANDLPPLEETLQPAECKKIPVLDVDELCSFIFRSKDKVWVWIAMKWVKKWGKRLILSVGIIPYGNSWHASYVRHCLFPNVLKCMS